MKKAIAVLSGGLDCTVASSVYAKDYEIHAITFNYGQKAFKRELKASKEICKKMGFSHSVIDLDWLAKISTSSLNTSEDIPEVDFNDLDDLEKSSESASSVWVPARNTVFTSIAASYAESIGAEIIIVGWDKEEANTFPDNSKEFLESFNELFKPEWLEKTLEKYKYATLEDCYAAIGFGAISPPPAFAQARTPKSKSGTRAL